MVANSLNASVDKSWEDSPSGYGSAEDVEIGERVESDFVPSGFWRTVYDEVGAPFDSKPLI